MVNYSTITYSGAEVKIAKIKKSGNVIRGSVDGNQYGTSYDKTIAQGFSDKDLIAQGFTEEFAGNGSIFYMWDNDCYAEGVEIAKGLNNQDFGMTCVKTFSDVMAVGFPKSGGIVFAKQKEITANASTYYGALTFAFGIMKNGEEAYWGRYEHASQFNTVSGRTILGQNADYIFAVSIAGTTGTTGLRGNQLYGLCKQLGMTDAGCFDGGGSVWLRVDGDYVNYTGRKVKNAWMIFSKPETKVESKPVEEPKKEESEKPVEVPATGLKFKVYSGSYGTSKEKIATRATASGKYSTSYPIIVGDIFTVDEMVSIGSDYIGHMADGRQAGRWVLLDAVCIKPF